MILLATYYIDTAEVSVYEQREGDDIYYDLFDDFECLNLGDPIYQDECPSREFVKSFLNLEE